MLHVVVEGWSPIRNVPVPPPSLHVKHCYAKCWMMSCVDWQVHKHRSQVGLT